MSGPTTEYMLLESFQTTVTANGEAWIEGKGPTQYGEIWRIESTQCLVQGSVNEARLRIYRNGRTQLVEGTYSGNQDTSNTTFELQSGEKLSYFFSGADVGSIAIITLQGKRVVRGSRAYG